jgi:hypothetical protein
MNGWLKVKTAAEYSDVCDKTVRRWFSRGLPYSRMDDGTILIKKEHLDAFITGFQESKVDEIVDSICRELQ